MVTPRTPPGPAVGSRCLPASGTFPQVECPSTVVEILDDFISTTGRHAEGDETARHLGSCDDTPGNGAVT